MLCLKVPTGGEKIKEENLESQAKAGEESVDDCEKTEPPANGEGP